MNTVRTTLKPCHESGNRTSWFKLVTKVDRSKKDGYAFEGEFIKADTEVELPENAIIIEKEPAGSVKNGYYLGNIYRVTSVPQTGFRNSHLEFIEEFNWQKQFLSFRDAVADLLEAPQSSPSPCPDINLVNEAIEKYRAECTEESQLFALISLLQHQLDQTRTFKL